MIVASVRAIEPRLVAIGGVGVLHGELAHADQATARTRLITPLCLEVIDLLRELAPRADELAQQIGNDLFVGHRKDHVAISAILESAHLWADLVVAPRLAPKVGWVHHRHEHLLPVDGVHLFADDLGDPLVDAHAEGEKRVDSSAERTNVSGAQEEAMRWHLRVGRVLALRREEEVADAHGWILAAALRVPAPGVDGPR